MLIIEVIQTGGSVCVETRSATTNTYAAVYAENYGTGPAADFRNMIRITDGTQGAGKVLTSDVSGYSSWQTPAAGPWQESDDNIYYNAGYVGIGTPTINYPLSIENSSNTCYIKLKDKYATGGMRVGAINGELALINDNVNKNIKFSINFGSGYFQLINWM
jgi:hypothetical protein